MECGSSAAALVSDSYDSTTNPHPTTDQISLHPVSSARASVHSVPVGEGLAPPSGSRAKPSRAPLLTMLNSKSPLRKKKRAPVASALFLVL
jgi:hypothetical protein